MHRELVYVAKSRIPSRWANSVQVAHMVCELAPFFERASLVLPFRLRPYLLSRFSDPFRSYGARRPANLRLRFLTGALRRPFEERAKALPLVDEGTLVYTRTLAVADWVTERGGAVLFESHDTEKDRTYRGFSAFVERLNASPRSRVVCISEVLKDLYRQNGAREDRLAVFHDGVHSGFFEARPLGLLDGFFGRTREGRRVVYVGSLSPEKGAGFLLDAAKVLPDYDFLVVGGSRREAEALAAQAKGVPNFFLRPAVRHDLVPALLAEADYLAMPYQPGGKWTHCMSPLKMFEYMASGKPILCADLPVLQEVLADETTCLMFEAGSVPSFREALDRYARMEPCAKEAVGRAARSLAEAFSWRIRARGILEWYYGLPGAALAGGADLASR